MIELLLDEIGHILFYIGFALLVYLFYRKEFSLYKFVLGLITTLAIDADHLLDYFLLSRERFRLQNFLLGGYFESSGKVIVLFHSLEIAALLFLLYFLFKKEKKHGWLLFVAISLLAHIIFDTLSYGFDWRSYLLINRMFHGFSISLFR